ncbi:hypothetical protein [Sphingomonas sp.]|uniref:hypothetical protein n=1 Tax=Sphingomonas sp. TaxID=28214 RepID=UPI003AFFE8EF
MIRLLAPALLAATIAAPAHAQYYYDPARPQPQDRQLPSYTDDERGYTGGWQARSDDMRPDYAPPAPPAPPGTNGGYRDDGRYAGYGDGYGYGPGDDGPAGYEESDAAPPPPARGTRAPRPGARSPYADRIARWRARADACEAGDRAACQGPE